MDKFDDAKENSILSERLSHSAWLAWSLAPHDGEIHTNDVELSVLTSIP